MNIEDEDEIIKQANKIKSDAFNEAERKWAETPDEEKKRPWPRCWNLTCNRTLVCLATNGGKCEGWEF